MAEPSKVCARCHELIPLDQFGGRPSSRDGLSYSCKKCVTSYDQEYYKSNRSKIIKRSVDWQKDNPERYAARLRRWAMENRDKAAQYLRDTRARHPEKDRARRAVNRAVAQGKLARGGCQVCGRARAEAHHEDYGKPLDIVWLCREHHTGLHHGKLQLIPQS